MNHSRVHADASEVTAEQGEVMIDGPGATAVSLTPEAAAETGQRLIEGGSEAAGQRYFKDHGAGEPADDEMGGDD